MSGFIYIIGFCILFLSIGCGGGEIVVHKTTVEGIQVELQLFKESATDVDKAFKVGMEVLKRRLKIVYDDEGELAILNKKRSLKTPSSDFLSLLTLSEQFQRETDGAFEPRFGEIKSLWHFNEGEPKSPESEKLNTALEKARATRVVIKSDEVLLEGLGTLDFGQLTLGWAVDGAYEAIFSQGITRGSIKVGEVVKYWGKFSEDFNWSMRIPDIIADSIFYIIKPEPGASAVIHPMINGFKLEGKNYPRVLDPKTGMPCDSVWAVVVWSNSASKASALSEALFVMGRRNALSYLLDKSEIGLFIIHGSGKDYAAETDPIMRDWVEVELP